MEEETLQTVSPVGCMPPSMSSLSLEQTMSPGDKPILLTLKKCPICRHHLSARNLPRHIREIYLNRLPRTKTDKFKTRDELRASNKSFKCTSPCKAAFARKHHLKRHKKSQTCFFNKKYLCIFCGKMFVTETAYWNHLNNRLCPKQFNCTVCQQYFSTSTELSVHSKYCYMEMK